MKIRNLKKSDIPEVVDLIRPMWLDHAKKSKPLLDYDYIAKYDVAGYLSRLLDDPTEIMFVAEIDDKIVGVASAKIEKPAGMYGVDKMMYLDDLVVHEDYRRQGIADKLMDARLDYAKSLGITKCYSKIYNFNTAPQQLAKKHGFSDLYHFYYKFLD